MKLPVELVASEANTSIDQISKVYWKPTPTHKMDIYTSIEPTDDAEVREIKKRE